MMKRTVLLSLLLLLAINSISSQDSEEEQISCLFDPEDQRFANVDPTEQNLIDRMIQKIQGTRLGAMIRRIIRRNIKNPNSVFRRALGRMLQDPNDENFEDGDLGVTKPVYGPMLSLLTKVFGETKTVVGYLRAFGFFSKVLGMSPNKLENYQGSIPPCAITQAVKEFQVFNNLEPTGKLTKETRDLMKKDRCGNPDVECETPECIAEKAAEVESHYLDRKKRALGRQKRYAVVSGRTWYFGDFKYFYQGYSTDLPEDVQRKEIARALKLWSDVANVNFEETDVEEDADIRIDFGGGDHGDRYPFDGPLGVLAHGYYPTNGNMHFDDDEFFTSNTYNGTNLYFVATHEFGHVLGIKHSTIRGAVMQAYYPGYKENIKLHQDDIDAVVDLFGAKPTPEPDTDECADKVDGGWSEYSSWSECSRGIQFRSRTCNNPPPSAKCGADCTGPGSQTRACSESAGKCSYGDYGDWTACTAECDGGVQYRRRKCTNDDTGDACSDCQGGDSESRQCNSQKCPTSEPKEQQLIPYSVVEQSSTWKSKSASLAVDDNDETKSSTKCTGSSHAWFRYKFAEENKVRIVEILNGNFNNKRYKLDNAVVYAESGNRAKFECGRVAVTDITSTKGQTYKIDCGGRLAASVKIVQEKKWNNRKCLDLKEVKVYGMSEFDDLTHPNETTSSKVDGGWSDYGDWSDCSVDCGRGTRTRTKTCTNPAPRNGGRACVGSATETEACVIVDCTTPVDGGWSDYSEWSECDAECGGGTQTRTKTCTDPAPADGGLDCEGEASESRDCNTQECTGLEESLLIPYSEVSQSSTAGSNSANFAVDGNLETLSKTTITSKNNAWFRYTLSTLHRVGKIKIVNGNLNRKRGKLDKAMVYVDTGSQKFECGSIKVTNTATTEGQTYIVDCGGRLANSVKIIQRTKFNKRKSLDLKEVKVYRARDGGEA